MRRFDWDCNDIRSALQPADHDAEVDRLVTRRWAAREPLVRLIVAASRGCGRRPWLGDQLDGWVEHSVIIGNSQFFHQPETDAKPEA